MESTAAKLEPPSKFIWYTFNGKSAQFKSKTGVTLKLDKGGLFGVRNLNNRTDRVVLLQRPDVIFLLPVEFVGDLIDKAKRFRGAVVYPELEPKAAKKPVVKAKPKPTKVSVKPEPKTKVSQAVKKILDLRKAKGPKKEIEKIKVSVAPPQVKKRSYIDSPDDWEENDDFNADDLGAPRFD